MEICAIVCHNGLGHFKRSLLVLDEIVSRAPGTEITILCEAWQVAAAGRWDFKTPLLKSARIITGLIEPGVHWSLTPEVYKDGRLMEWESRLTGVPEISRADVVLSDNLTGVLNLRPDAVLMGSFLWSDVLAYAFSGSTPVELFVDGERATLQKYKPPMICVRDMVMPGVLEKTAAVAVPWHFNGADRSRMVRSKQVKRVGILSGATGTADKILSQISDTLKQRGTFEIFEPSSVEKAYPHLDLAICRPGMGSMTDCVKHRIPMVAVYDKNNLEMAHNARRIVELKLGIAVEWSETTGRGDEIMDYMVSPDYRESGERLAVCRGGGVEESAEWILNYPSNRKK